MRPPRSTPPIRRSRRVEPQRQTDQSTTLTNEQPDNKFDRHRQSVSTASKDYIDSRDAWKKATAELEQSDPCSATHPSKVQAGILALNNFLAASERMQVVCKKNA